MTRCFPGRRVRPADLGSKLSGLDRAMLGDDAWDETFLTMLLEFESSVLDLEHLIRAWLTAQLDDPQNKLRLRLEKSGRDWYYKFNDEDTRSMVDRILVPCDQIGLEAMPSKSRANPDALSILVCPSSFLLSISHVFVDGMATWRLMKDLLEHAKMPKIPRVQYWAGVTELLSIRAIVRFARSGVPKTPFRLLSEPERRYPTIDLAPLREMRHHHHNAPFLAGLCGVVCASVWHTLAKAGVKAPARLNVGVIAAFDVPHTSHFNDFGIIPIAVTRPAGEDIGANALNIQRQAALQIKQRAPLAVLTWSRANVYNSQKGFFTLDVALSCAPLVGEWQQPLSLKATGTRVKQMKAHLYTWTPIFCAAASYDSKADLSLLVKAADVPADALVENITGCLSEVTSNLRRGPQR